MNWVKTKKLLVQINKYLDYELNQIRTDPNFPEMENELDKWIADLRGRGCIVSSFSIKVIYFYSIFYMYIIKIIKYKS